MSKRFSGTSLLTVLAAASLGTLFTPIVQAADYPDRTVNWVVPYPPGGPTDTATRVLAEAFSKELNQTFVVENRPGASGTIGTRYTLRSKPDGYTISMFASPSLTAPFMLAQSPYNTETDLASIGLAYFTPLILVVNPDVLPDVIDIESFAAAVKDKGLNYTSAGVGSTGHLTMELLRAELGFEATHIPFQGSSPAVTAVLSGEIPAMMSDSVAVLPHIRAGKLRPIAVNAKERLAAIPEVALLTEQDIKSVEAVSWVGVFAAKNTPQEAINTLNTTLKKVLQDDEIAKRMIQVGAYPLYSTPEGMDEIIKIDSATWKKVIEDNNLKQQ